jgi:hypothetical protein
MFSLTNSIEDLECWFQLLLLIKNKKQNKKQNLNIVGSSQCVWSVWTNLLRFWKTSFCLSFIVYLLFSRCYSCSKNCKDKITSDEKTILQSACSAFCTGELTFSWSLYCYDDINTPEPLNLSSLHEIPQSEFQDMVYNPINELDLAIKPYSLQPGKKYTLAFRATRPTGALGELRTTLLVNSPPAGGK